MSINFLNKSEYPVTVLHIFQEKAMACPNYTLHLSYCINPQKTHPNLSHFLTATMILHCVSYFTSHPNNHHILPITNDTIADRGPRQRSHKNNKGSSFRGCFKATQSTSSTPSSGLSSHVTTRLLQSQNEPAQDISPNGLRK